MTKEELLTPRYKVIADWPGNEWEVGTILQKMDNTAAWLSPNNNIYTGIRIEGADKYPHLFKKLEWVEDRKESDLPKYVKTTSGNRVAKARFDLNETSAYFMFLDDDIHPYSPFGWLPSDEEEYNQYIQKQTP